MQIRQLALRALLGASVVVFATAGIAQGQSAPALVGTWNLTLTSPQGTHPGTVTIKNEAGKLAGAMTGDMGSLPVDVQTTETGVALSFTVDYQGQPLPVVLAGKVDGATMKGTVDYGNGAAAGDFSGTRAGAASGTPAGGAAGAAGTTVSGAWDITGDGGGGYSFDLTQNASAVTGVLKAPNGAEMPVKGTFENNALTLAVSLDGAAGTVKGTLDGAGLKGTYDIGGNTGSYSATRKP